MEIPSPPPTTPRSEIVPVPQLETITISPQLTFDALVAGRPGAPLVLLLHGFAESMQCWRAQLAALADAGYRAVAPSQRGYSPGARPDIGDLRIIISTG
jgi:pimeloyl-ACP methyl ester carboxylesterase